MDPLALKPFGVALRAYFEGDAGAELTFRRDDGHEGCVPASHFFREPSAFTPIEKAALARAFGRVLDVGGGSGLHSLALQEGGFPVTAIDINSDAVEIMARRGVKEVRCIDLFDYQGGPFDTLLLLGHGIGMVETIAGLDRFLEHAHRLVSATGQVLVNSMDVSATQDSRHLAYHEANRRKRGYIGEIRMRIEHQDLKGPYCGWLQVDSGTLGEHAMAAGWDCQVIITGEGGDYLARLTRRRGP